MISSSSDEPTTATTKTPTNGAATKEADLLAHVPVRDYVGYEFNILGYDTFETSNPEYSSEEETGEVIIDAIFFRNRAVEERFNIKINYACCQRPTWTKPSSAPPSRGTTPTIF